ncbi:unnamed protein product [Boreogadus saida]
MDGPGAQLSADVRSPLLFQSNPCSHQYHFNPPSFRLFCFFSRFPKRQNGCAAIGQQPAWAHCVEPLFVVPLDSTLPPAQTVVLLACWKSAWSWNCKISFRFVRQQSS